MAWQGPATRKATDKIRDKAAKAAQSWLIRGFTPEQAAEGICNKIGILAKPKNNTVEFWGFYNDETIKDQRITRVITAEEIIKP